MRSHKLRAAAAVKEVFDPTTKNLNRWYDFGNTNSFTANSVNIYDLSGNGYNARFYSGHVPSYSSSNGGYIIMGTGTNSGLSGTFYPDGNTSFQQTLVRLAGTGNFTIEMWLNLYHYGQFATEKEVYLNNAGKINYSPFGIFYYKMTLFVHATGWSHEGLIGSSNRVGGGMQTGNLTTNTYGSTVGMQGWQHIVLTRTSTGTNGLKLYINNSLEFTGTNSINYNNPSLSDTFGSKYYYGGPVGPTPVSTTNSTFYAIHREYLDGFTAADVAASFNTDRSRFGV